MEITKEDYESNYERIQKYEPHKAIIELGEFHITKNGKIVFSGEKYWSENRFFVFDKIEEIVKYDPELSNFFPKRLRIADEELIANLVSFDPIIVDYEIVNFKDAIEIISKLLRIRTDLLDCSIASLEEIDNHTAEAPNDYRYYLIIPLICYVAKMLTDKFDNVKLEIKDDGSNFYMVRSDKYTSNIGVIASDYYLQSDYCPTIYMVYRAVVLELKLN